MHTLLSSDLTKFQIDLLNVAIRNSIQTDKILEIFPTNFLIFVYGISQKLMKLEI